MPLEGSSGKATVHSNGLLIPGNDGKMVNVKQLQFEDGKMIQACNFGQEVEEVQIEFTAEEDAMAQTIKVRKQPIYVMLQGQKGEKTDGIYFLLR